MWWSSDDEVFENRRRCGKLFAWVAWCLRFVPKRRQRLHLSISQNQPILLQNRSLDNISSIEEIFRWLGNLQLKNMNGTQRPYMGRAESGILKFVAVISAWNKRPDIRLRSPHFLSSRAGGWVAGTIKPVNAHYFHGNVIHRKWTKICHLFNSFLHSRLSSSRVDGWWQNTSLLPWKGC